MDRVWSEGKKEIKNDVWIGESMGRSTIHRTSSKQIDLPGFGLGVAAKDGHEDLSLGRSTRKGEEYAFK